MEIFPGITVDPEVRFGKPCVAGTRVDVATVVGAVAAGEAASAVGEEFGLTLEQVHTALLYAAHLAGHVPPAVREVS